MAAWQYSASNFGLLLFFVLFAQLGANGSTSNRNSTHSIHTFHTKMFANLLVWVNDQGRWHTLKDQSGNKHVLSSKLFVPTVWGSMRLGSMIAQTSQGHSTSQFWRNAHFWIRSQVMCICVFGGGKNSLGCIYPEVWDCWGCQCWTWCARQSWLPASLAPGQKLD